VINSASKLETKILP